MWSETGRIAYVLLVQDPDQIRSGFNFCKTGLEPD